MIRKVLLAVALALLAAPAAQAAIVPGQVIDGPSADVQRFGDVDIAPDGTGALVYVKKVAGNDNIFVSLFNGTSWRAPQRVSNDTSCPAAAACKDPHVAAGNGGRVVVTFVGESTKLYAAVKPDGASPFGTASDAAPGSDTLVQGDDLDMDPVSGVAYAIIDQNSVRATRLSGTTWTEIPGTLDNPAGDDAGQAIGGQQNTARVAVDTAGNAVAAWPAQDTGGKKQVYARRIVGTTTPDPSIKISVAKLANADFDGANNDSVYIDGGGSPDPWIAFREQFTYGANGRVRDLVSQLVGNTPSPPQPIDGLPLDNLTEGAEFPQIDINPTGQGIATGARQLTFHPFLSLLSAGVWSAGQFVDAGTPGNQTFTSVAISDSGSGLIAWRDETASPSPVVARVGVGGAQMTLSRNGDGPILSALDAIIGMSTSSSGTVAVAFGQGNGATTNEIVAAVVNLPQQGGGGGGGGGKDTTPPSVSKLKISHRTFRLGKELATVSRKTPVGTTISFTVSEQSKTTFTFARKARGFKSGKRCLAHRPKGHKKAKRCTRFVRVKPSLVFQTPSGPHKVKFQGRLSKRRKLKPGTYRLSVTSVDAAGNKSKARTATLRAKR